VDEEAIEQHEKLQDKIQQLRDDIKDIHVLIVGNPPKQKGVFQRLDETNGKIKLLKLVVIGIVMYILGTATPKVAAIIAALG